MAANRSPPVFLGLTFLFLFSTALENHMKTNDSRYIEEFRFVYTLLFIIIGTEHFYHISKMVRMACSWSLVTMYWICDPLRREGRFVWYIVCFDRRWHSLHVFKSVDGGRWF